MIDGTQQKKLRTRSGAGGKLKGWKRWRAVATISTTMTIGTQESR
jgi:hypothetical protein